MPKHQVPDDADPVFKAVMKAMREGKNPSHDQRKKLDARQRKELEKSWRDYERKRKGRHRAGGGDVIDTGMFS